MSCSCGLSKWPYTTFSARVNGRLSLSVSFSPL